MSRVASFDQADNPYRSSSVATLDTLDLPIDGVTAEDVQALRAFVGRKSDYYLRKWEPRLLDPEAETGMNWAAFFLAGFWITYRKMYRLTFLLFGISILISVLNRFFFLGIIGAKTVHPAIEPIMGLMVSIVCGLYGNAWYLDHARRKITQARSEGLEDTPLLIALTQRGGTNLGASLGIWLGIPILLGIVIGIFVAAARVAG